MPWTSPDALQSHPFRYGFAIDPTKVGGSGITDYVLRLQEAHFPNSFFTRCRSDGLDIQCALSDGTLLKRDLISIDTGSRLIQMNVRITSALSTTVGSPTRVFVYCGDGVSRANDTDTYISSYIGFWPFSENPAGSAPQVLDRTSNAFHGTSGGSMVSGDSVSGQVGRALTFDGTTKYVDFGTGSAADFTTGDFSISLLIKPASSGQTPYPVILCRGLYATDGWYIQLSTGGGAWFGSTKAGAVAQPITTVDGVVTAGQYSRITFIRSGTSTTFRINTSEPGYNTHDALSAIVTSTRHLYAARYNTQGDNNFKGEIDEITLRNTAISSALDATEYQNQFFPTAFCPAATEQWRDPQAFFLAA